MYLYTSTWQRKCFLIIRKVFFLLFLILLIFILFFTPNIFFRHWPGDPCP